MAKKRKMYQKGGARMGLIIPFVFIGLAVLLLLFIAGNALLTHLAPEETGAPETTHSTALVPNTTITSQPTTTQPPTDPPVRKVSTATIGSTGDILLHDKVIRSGYDSATGTYNYESIFTYFSEFVSNVDYAVGNLEVTLCSDDNGFPYKGYPCFNAPDAIVDAAKAAGFDMLLTANNHSYDTGTKGFMRTQEVIMERELDYIGTRYKEEDKNYIVKDINGIKIGMICYTYNTSANSDGIVSLNGMTLDAASSGLINSFNYGALDSFYSKLSGEMEQMKAEGAEAIMVYLHWGEEYQTEANSTQKKMAQALCDLGVDVIVGNHAHVPQPIELLTNTKDEKQKTLCLYSMGNSISNIRGSKYPKETEDGMLFSVTFAKYSDGTVVLESTDVLPTWVNRYVENDVSKYKVLTMDRADKDNWQEKMSLTEELLSACQASYDRTMAIVGEGLETANAYYTQHQLEVESLIGVKE